MKTPSRDPWQQLVALARQAPVDEGGGAEAPLGFSTRVVARGLASGGGRQSSGLFEPLAWRALSVASVLAIVTVALTFSPVLQAFHEEAAATTFDSDAVTRSVLEQ